MRETDQARAGVLLVLAAGSLWGSMGIFVRYFGAAGLNSIQIVAARILVTVLVLFPALAVFRRPLLKVRLRDCWCFLGSGLCSIVMFSYCYFSTIAATSLSVAAVLLYCAPIFVMLMSVLFFGERLTGIKLLACLLAFAGCALVSGVAGGVSVPASAFLTGFGSAFGYALYSIFSRFALNRGYHPLTITAYTFLFALFGVAPLTDVGGLAAFVGTSPAELAPVLVMGLITSVFPYVLYTAGLGRIESSRASIIASIEPVVATVVGLVAFGEPISLPGFAGVCLVLLAILLLNRPVRTAQMVK